MIYLDNAATTHIKPLNVKTAVNRAIELYSVNPGRGGYKASLRASEAIYKVRKSVCGFFGGYKEENVLFFGSCTQALNQVIFGVLKEGDHCVISDLEHNAVLRPLYEMKRRGADFTVAETFQGDDAKTLDSFRKAIRKNTRLIVCTLASNVWGTVLPYKKIAALSKLYGIKFCADASQAAGLLEINMKESMIDYLCFSAHKGLYGIMGLGVLIMGENLEAQPLVYGGTGVDSLSESQPLLLPERYESGTLNTPGILALGEGIDFINKKGIGNIYKYEMGIASYIYDNLKERNKIKLYTGRPEMDNSLPVLSFNTDIPSEQMGNMYDSYGIAVRCGLHCSPLAHKKYGTEKSGAVRVSPSVFTSMNEAYAFIRATDGIIKKVSR